MKMKSGYKTSRCMALLIAVMMLGGCGKETAHPSAAQTASAQGEATTAAAGATTAASGDAAGISDGTTTAADSTTGTTTDTTATSEATTASSQDTTAASGESAASNPDALPAPDFSLQDQFGNTHTLSDYKGQVVFLNFWATWCPPCRAEMPDIQKLYEEYAAQETPEVVILGVAGPGNVDDKDTAGIAAFLEENGYTYPTVMDEKGDLFVQYYITAYPTTFMIDKAGNVFGYVQGSMTEDVMRDIIEQTLSGQMRQNG